MNTSTSPAVTYTHLEMSGGANASDRLTATYPGGQVVDYAYDMIGRVVRDRTNGTARTYAKRSGESNGDAGDRYIGLDRFGRVVDQRWLLSSSGTALDRFQYGYDRAGNRLFRDNLVSAGFGELYGYDGLDQLASFDRGTLNGTRAVPSASSYRWAYLQQGLRWDGTAALYQNRHRWYGPTLGLFMGLDPLRYDAVDVNLCRYVGNGLWFRASIRAGSSRRLRSRESLLSPAYPTRRPELTPSTRSNEARSSSLLRQSTTL